MLVLVVVHVLGCFWYFLGRRNAEEPDGSWLSGQGVNDETPFSDSYIITTLWVLRQVVNDVQFEPTNTEERLFASFCILFSLIVMGSLISQLISTTAMLRDHNAEQLAATRDLNNYFSIHPEVPVELSSRLRRFSRHW